MRTLAWVVALVFLAAVPRPANAQCGPFSATPCSNSQRPIFHVDFGQQKAPAPSPKPASTSIIPKVQVTVFSPRPPIKEDAVDCQMVKPVNPRFKSAMPVVVPKKNADLPMRVVQPPPCKR